MKIHRFVGSTVMALVGVLASAGVAFGLNPQPDLPVPELSGSGTATALALVVGTLALVLERKLRRRRS
jgi:hypothetical protein